MATIVKNRIVTLMHMQKIIVNTDRPTISAATIREEDTSKSYSLARGNQKRML